MTQTKIGWATTLIVLLAVTLPVVPAALAGEAEDKAQAAQLVKQFAGELDRCSHAADLEGFMALSADDVVFLPPDQPAVEGAVAVRDWYKGLWAAQAIEMQHAVAEVQTVGDLVVARGSARGTATPVRAVHRLHSTTSSSSCSGVPLTVRSRPGA